MLVYSQKNHTCQSLRQNDVIFFLPPSHLKIDIFNRDLDACVCSKTQFMELIHTGNGTHAQLLSEIRMTFNTFQNH